ncbi:MAG: DUF1501 domain-containing protein, partial [Chloroflexi bacterium]|nr:DUF1501 domain-containing protein [Chloroflexota bacterium]
GLLNLSIPGMVAARVDGDKPRQGAAEKSCIFILLCGGPSHLDSWDLKPNIRIQAPVGATVSQRTGNRPRSPTAPDAARWAYGRPAFGILDWRRITRKGEA